MGWGTLGGSRFPQPGSDCNRFFPFFQNWISYFSSSTFFLFYETNNQEKLFYHDPIFLCCHSRRQQKQYGLFGMRINHRRRPFWRFPHKIADLLVWDRGWGWVITIRKGLPSPSIATVFRLPRYYPLTFAIPVILLSLTCASQQTASIGFGKGTEMISCNNGV